MIEAVTRSSKSRLTAFPTSTPLPAHSVDRDRPFRPIVITDSGDRDHVRGPVEHVVARGMMV